MTQSLLFPVEIIDPAEDESIAHTIARRNAYDIWNAAFLQRFYAARSRAVRVVHCRRQPYDIYIGRANSRAGLPASKWGNPFIIGRDGTRDEVIAKYAAWIVQQPELMAALPELRGKALGCWCAPEHACHGEILAALVNAAQPIG